MYCTSCGNAINDGDRFCTNCGASVFDDGIANDPTAVFSDASNALSGDMYSASSEISSGVSHEAQPDIHSWVDEASFVPVSQGGAGSSFTDVHGMGVTSGKSNRRRNIVIAIVIAAAVVVAIVLAAMFIFQESDEQVTEAYFGSSERIKVARSTVIIPRDSSGTSVSNYTVSVESANDESGNSIDVSGYPRLIIENTEGFTISDIIGDDGDEGVYNIVVTDENGNEQELPPIEVDDSTESDIVYVEPDPQLVSYAALFLDKINEIIDEHGGPEIVTYSGYANISYSYLVGLGYADLIDFGDGEQRLVVVYADRYTMLSYDSDPAAYGVVNDYILEIWEVDDSGDSLSLAWSGLAATTNGGYPTVTMYTDSDSGNLAVQARVFTEDYTTIVTIGLNDSYEISEVDISLFDTTWRGEFFELCGIIVGGQYQTEDIAQYHAIDETSEIVPDLVAELEWLVGETSSGF